MESVGTCPGSPQSNHLKWGRTKFEERARVPWPLCGACFIPCQLLVFLSVCLWTCFMIMFRMLAAFRWRGKAALPGFRKRKGPEGLVELFVSGEAFEVTGAGYNCLVWSRVLCPRPVNPCGPWVFSQARERKEATCHFLGIFGDSDWPWGVKWPSRPAPGRECFPQVAVHWPPCTLGPIEGPAMLGRSHRLGFTDRIWPSRAKTTETGQRAPCVGLSFPTCEMGQFLMLLWDPYFSTSPVQN